METNLYYCTRTGRTISEKTMEDGNLTNTRDDKIGSASLTHFYGERPAKLTTNGHDFAGESSSPPESFYGSRRASADPLQEDKFRKRINPLRIHLGKRPFVDSSGPYSSACKKKKHFVIKPSESSVSKNSAPRVPKLIPKRVECNPFHNTTLQADNLLENEQDKPVPRLVPKSQLLQFKKGKAEKGPQLKEYAQSLGLQPMVKFKCRKCCSMSFKTLAMLKEHQLICRAQVKEPALSPEVAPNSDNNSGGPSRVTRKVYLCSACGTYYENWNLFLHMREVHNRHICLFCLGMFSKAEKLSAHLTNKHNVQEFSYHSKEDFFKVYNGTLYLMCCRCDEICSEQDDFFNHDCNNVKPKPVPVLVSKKPNNFKYAKNGNELPRNGSSVSGKNLAMKSTIDKVEANNVKSETVTTNKAIIDTGESEPVNSDTSISSDSSVSTSKDTSSTVDSVIGQNSSNLKPSTPIQQNNTLENSRSHIPNGDENLEHSDESDSPVPDEIHLSSQQPQLPSIVEEKTSLPEREKEGGGIKLKLSLNNANSPVIINSTVDPSIGQQYKPPSRVRRPPKRYEKDVPPETSSPIRPTSIKMTICDKADSPFIKTTIIENNEMTTPKVNENNSLDSLSQLPDDLNDIESKTDSTVKSTIYDNKLEDNNTLNRVPKLTVRVPKEFLDKDSSSDYSSDSEIGEKLSMEDQNITTEHLQNVKEKSPIKDLEESQLSMEVSPAKVELEQPLHDKVQTENENVQLDIEPKTEPKEDILNIEEPSPTDNMPIIELTLDRPLDKYPLKDLLKVFLASTVLNCIYCNHARKIAVNCEQLALHLVAEHRFSATVNSITAEELMPQTIAAKVKARLDEVCTVFINLDSYDSVDKSEDVQYNHIFECFQCFFKTAVLKDLYLHNRKMHQKTILLCIMCKSNFYSYSELLCHLCPGTYDSEYENRFRCCLCNVDAITSSFRLMVHLRKIHHTCDVCLEFCQSQARLSNHVWKHKLHHLCYRCGIAYRNKPDITNHLFWKHGTESVLCKKCLQKKWPHVYHFCTPPAVFVCEECSLQFTRPVCLKVHKRFHSEEFPHACIEENCTEKFVSKKLLAKHTEEHKQKLLVDNPPEDNVIITNDKPTEDKKEPVAVVDSHVDKPTEETEKSEVKAEAHSDQVAKKPKKKKLKDKDALLLDVNLPALNLSESDSSDESDSGIPPSIKDEGTIDKLDEESQEEKPVISDKNEPVVSPTVEPLIKTDDLIEQPEEKPDEKQVLEIWDNFKKYQAKVEKQKEKTPPLVPIRKHVCDSDHDYCLIPVEVNGDDDVFDLDKKKNKKSPKKKHGGLSSSSSSSSDSDSSCSCGSNCSCSSSSGSSSSSSSDSDSSDESGTEKKKNKQIRKSLPNRRISNGSNVDVMGMSETPVLVPEKTEPLIAESDLETEESETDEEFYDKNPQKIANKLYAEKRNQLMLLASVAPSDGGSMSGEASRAATPVKEEIGLKSEANPVMDQPEFKEKTSSSKKRSKKKKRSKSSRKHGPIKINIPMEVISTSEAEAAPPPLPPNKITISLQANTVQIPEPPKLSPVPSGNTNTLPTAKATPLEKKRASKRRRVPNKFYGYSSDEDSPQVTSALKPQLPPKLEWRKEDLPSPAPHKAKKEIPSSVVPQRTFNYTEPIRLTALIPDPEPPKILMNSESMESSESDTSDEGALEIYQPNSVQNSIPVPPPTYLNSGTSSLPYPFQRPAVRQAREGESVYCYCRCPYDEVSEMIACDADGCAIEWFHFECVGIMVPPKGKWYCPECRKNQNVAGFRN